MKYIYTIFLVFIFSLAMGQEKASTKDESKKQEKEQIANSNKQTLSKQQLRKINRIKYCRKNQKMQMQRQRVIMENKRKGQVKRGMNAGNYSKRLK